MSALIHFCLFFSTFIPLLSWCAVPLLCLSLPIKPVCSVDAGSFVGLQCVFGVDFCSFSVAVVELCFLCETVLWWLRSSSCLKTFNQKPEVQDQEVVSFSCTEMG